MALGGDCHGSTEPLSASYNRDRYSTSVFSVLAKAKMAKYVNRTGKPYGRNTGGLERWILLWLFCCSLNKERVGNGGPLQLELPFHWQTHIT